MGPRLSLLAPSAPTVAILSYIDVLRDYRYVETVNNSRFLKTIKAVDRNGNLVIIKMLIKPAGYAIQLRAAAELVARQCQMIAHHSNCLPWHKIIETDRAAYLVRQMVKTNLYDRISIRPFLEPIEKLFLVFQMLRVIEDIHELGIYHGDLKLENFLVTLWNWLMLVDFANLKPAHIPEDNPNQFSFYFDTSDRRLCYIAPERFYNGKETSKHPTFTDDGEHTELLDSKMDMFSLGCVIAELFSDGEPTFTLSQLFKYVKQEFVPDLSNIKNPEMKALVKELLLLDPQSRPSAREVLEKYKHRCFPQHFYTFLYGFMSELNENPDTDASDVKLEMIYESYKDIVTELNLEGGEEVPNLEKAIHHGYSQTQDFAPTLTQDQNDPPQVDSGISTGSALIPLNLVFSLIKSLKQVGSKIKACELIVALSAHISDGSKLDRSLPYLCLLVDEYIEVVRSPAGGLSASPKVVCLALRAITSLLSSCEHITPINVYVFPEYLLPKLSSLFSLNVPTEDKDMIKMTLATCLPELATVLKRFWVLAKTLLPGEGGSSQLSKDDLDADFEGIAFSLLTDPNTNVKISFLDHIRPLCENFGVDKTNDLILPHLITYLNDPDSQLRLAFLRAVLEVGPYVGVLLFEQYMLPLLIQTLGDSEQFVVLKVLEIFTQFVSTRVINPRFNALDIYSALVASSVNLLLHPNAWIRQSVMQLIIAVSENLDEADRYCFLYPLIKQFLSYDLADLTWDTLYPCVTSPLSRAVYDLTVTWCIHSTSKSLFWQEKNFLRTVVTKHHGMGKLVYLPRLNSKVTFQLANGSKSSVPLSPEDKLWLIKLKSVGLTDRDLWKVFILRDYIYSVSRMASSVTSNAEFNMVTAFSEMTPRNIFFEVHYKSEPLTVGSTVELNVDTMPSDSVSLNNDDSRSLVLPGMHKLKASIQTVEANVFGELQFSHEEDERPTDAKRTLETRANFDHSTQSAFSVNSKLITTATKHSYSGTNPNIMSYLNSVEFEATLDNFPEFGVFVKRSAPVSGNWDPRGVLIAKIDTSDSGEIDGINCLEVGPTSEFFVTGSELGHIKVWDAYKIEKAASAKSSSILIALGSSVTSIAFAQNRFCFAASTADGRLRIYRIEVARTKNRRIKHMKAHLVREHHIASASREHILALRIEGKFLIGITSSSRIVAYDIIRMQKSWLVCNPLEYGTPKTFIVGDKMSWLLLGTLNGILCLWDLRFKLLIKSWRVIGDKADGGAITKLTLTSNGFAMIGPLNDLTVWDIPSFECTKVCSSNEYAEPYKLVECSYLAPDVDELLQSLSLKVSPAHFLDDERKMSHSFTALDFSHGYFVTATWDRRLVLWDATNHSSSISLNYDSKFTSAMRNGVPVVLEVGVSAADPVVGYKKELYTLAEASRLQHTKAIQDTITDVGVVIRPLEMVIAVDRSGCVYVYK